VEFTKANNANKVVLAWGGHIASLQDWGQGNSASAISGSPYHMFIENVRQVSNSTLVCNGNMDCQLAADAVTPVPTCTLTGPTLICPNVYPINYTATLDASQNGAVSFQWVLTNQNLSADARLTGTISGTTSAASITGLVTPASPNFTPGGTYLLQLQVIRDGSVGICYLNSATAPGAVVRVNNASLSATANPSSISLNSTSVISLSASALLDGQPADASFSYDWTAVSPGGLQGGTLSSSTSRTPTFTAVASGTYVFKVRATQQTAPFCVDSALVTVSVEAEQRCPSVPALPICAQSSGLTYAASSPAAAGVNYSWSVNNGASLQSENGLQSITVNAGAVSFDLSLTLDYLNPLLQNLVCTYPITVNALPAVSTGSYGPYCAGASVVNLSGTPAGGTWSGSGVSGSSFDPAVAGVYSVTYSYTDENGCSAAA
ncbi:MAG: PKD domain-containing protein, partial [Sphingomonadales bacterium]